MTDSIASKVSILRVNSTPSEQEAALSRTLGLPLLAANKLQASAVDYYLRFDPEGLSLYSNEPGAPGAVRVDFSDAGLNYRARDSIKHQNIVKAIGLRGSNIPNVLDATAGLAKDAYLLASLGCKVQMLERSGIVHALLADGINRGLQAEAKTAEIVRNMQLRNVDFFAVACHLPPVDVVYLDPMFQIRSKSARAKKEMYLLQRLLGTSGDISKMLELALSLACRRVVVKRAKMSPCLAGRSPDIEFKGSSSRYDVYLTRAGAPV